MTDLTPEEKIKALEAQVVRMKSGFQRISNLCDIYGTSGYTIFIFRDGIRDAIKDALKK